MTKLENQFYVVSNPDVIEALCTDMFRSEQMVGNGRITYLRTLVATLSHKLGSDKPRLRSVFGTKIADDQIAEQLAALDALHKEFMQAVLKAARAVYSGADVHRATTFARTSASVVRSYIRAGNDITTVAAKHVTKAMLSVPAVRKKKLSAKRLESRASVSAEHLQATVKALASIDQPKAATVVRPILRALARFAGISSTVVNKMDATIGASLSDKRATAALQCRRPVVIRQWE